MKECVKISLSTYDEIKKQEEYLKNLISNYQETQSRLVRRLDAAEKKFADLVRYLSENRMDVDSVYELFSWTREDLEAIGLLEDVEKILAKVRAEKKEAKEKAMREAEAQAELEKSEAKDSRSENGNVVELQEVSIGDELVAKEI